MPRSIMIYPLLGCFAGYAGASLAGVEDSLLIFAISIVTMIAASVGGFFFSRRSGRS